MRRLAFLGCVLAQISAVAAFVAYATIAHDATEAYVIAKNEDKKIGLNRDMFNPKAPNEPESDYKYRVMEIYGSRVEYTTPVVCVPREKFLHPEEMPSLTLLLVDLDKGQTPVQVKSIWFFTRYVVIGAEITFVVLLLLWFFLKPSRSDQPATSS